MRKIATRTLGQNHSDNSVRLSETHTLGQGPYRGPVRLSECVVALVKGVSCPSERSEKIRQAKAGLATWSESNPYKARLAKRLARLGGPHKPSTASDDRHVMREQVAVDLKREALELQDKPSCPF